MCGILGYISLNTKKNNYKEIKTNLSLLNHRGPDEQKIIKFKYGSIGHTRLSIIGLKTKQASQPIFKEKKILSFNGEIYNYSYLSNELKKRKIVVSGKSDTEVLFLLLKNFGIKETLKKIDGMYAFSWCDLQKKECYLVRDKIGEKSLYYYINNNNFYFGSEIKSLIKLNGTKKSINLKKLSDYFYTGKINGNETFFKKIFEVEPGQIIKYDFKKNNLRKSFFWKIENKLKKKKKIDKNFELNLRNSIKSRFVSDVPIGIMLSSGLDSSTLFRILLEEFKNKEFTTFTATNKLKKFNENQKVDMLLKYLKKKFTNKIKNYRISPINFKEYLKEFKKISFFYDEPIQLFMSPLLSKICHNAKKNNFKVLYGGEGADEIFYGYDRFNRTKKYIKNIKSKKESISHIFYGAGYRNKKIVKNILGKLHTSKEKLEGWKWLNKNYKKFDKDTLQTVFSQKYAMQKLLQRNDRIGMAHSVEIRSPFLSPDFVEKVNNYPLNSKFDEEKNITKLLIRKIMNKKLPKNIVNSKKKMPFSSDFQQMLFTDEFKRSLLNYINNQYSFSKKFLNLKEIIKIIKIHFSKKQDYHHLLWKIFSLEIWFKELNSFLKKP